MIVRKQAKCGCEGCIYANADKCPADPDDGQLTFDFDSCSDDETGAIIFEEEENE